MVSKEELIQFEKDVKQIFLDGKLRSPVHLSGGNENELIEIFKQIKPQDWVFTTYRSHYHALLKGVPEERLKNWVLDNKSIHFMDKEHRVFSSAIVGGTLPIALGVAMGIKHRCEAIRQHISTITFDDVEIGKVEVVPSQTVWCFIGDMTASLGVFNDCLKYAKNHGLPIKFVIENNTFSTDTKTAEVWNVDQDTMDADLDWLSTTNRYVFYYKYQRTYPHYGVGVFVDFENQNKQKEDKGF